MEHYSHSAEAAGYPDRKFGYPLAGVKISTA